MNKQLYCNICKKTTTHQLRGKQQGVPGKTLDLYDCLRCRDTCGRWEEDNLNFKPQYIGSMTFDIPDNSRLGQLFRENHPHLAGWLNSGLGRKYLEIQNTQTAIRGLK